MSHISTVKSKIHFTDKTALKSALEHFGAVIDGSGAISVVPTIPIPAIPSLSFLKQGAEWVARADQWGDQARYEAFVGRIGQQYSKVLTQDFITKNHLSMASQGTDAENNIRIKVRSYI